MSDLKLDWRARPLTRGGLRLRLDPAISQELRALQIGMRDLRLADLVLRPNWAGLRQGVVDEALRVPPVPGSATLPRGQGPRAPRAAELADLMQALWAIPGIQKAVGQVIDGASLELRRSWAQTSAANQVLLVTWSGVIAANAVAAAIANRAVRTTALGAIAGLDLPVPGVEGLTVRLAPAGRSVRYRDIAGSGVSVDGRLQRDVGRLDYELRITFDLARHLP